jgi:uncharacterized LabA/DUF88 family protein
MTEQSILSPIVATAEVAIFVDAENARWLCEESLAALIQTVSRYGRVRHLRAFADWRHASPKTLTSYTRHGFELTQVYLPVAKKNSADVALAVDVMDHLWRFPAIGCVVLVTGDSDFTPVFRRVRERSVECVGCGPRSVLSELVVSHCTEFILAESLVGQGAQQGKAVASPRPDPARVKLDPIEPWRARLRKLCWPSVDAGRLLAVAAAGGAVDEGMSIGELKAHLAGLRPDLGTPAEIGRALELIFKAQLMERKGSASWVRADLDDAMVLDAVDRAMLGRLCTAAEREGLEPPLEAVLALLLGPATADRLARLRASPAQDEE